MNKGIEDRIQSFWRDAYAGVTHFDDELRFGGGVEARHQLYPTRLRELDGVACQVGEDLT